jgi:hypothetical protein
MNLVPLQAAIAQEGRRPRGVAISGANAGVALTYERFAGDGLAVVDPLDIDGTADTLVAAVQGRLPGMSDAFVKTVAAWDSSHWAAGFMAALEEADAR